MTYNELGKAIFECSYLKGEFLLRSGVISNEYFDKYQFESRPEILNAIAKKMSLMFKPPFDIIAGLETGGIPLATAISLQTGIPLIFVRKNAKTYGTCKIAEGVDFAGKNVIIIEDIVTSGGQVILSVEELRKAGAIINTAICVIDRESGGRETLEKSGIELISLFKMSELKNLI